MGNDHAKFAALILTHGRPDTVVTARTLRRCGYTGRIVIVIDDEDATADRYRENYGADVVMFDKAAAGEGFDIADTLTDRRATVFARNASFQIAADLGLDYFVQFDDDYIMFQHRWLDDDGWTLRSARARNLDAVIDATLTLLDDTGALSVAWSQGGDHIGGLYLRKQRGVLRKAMNSWFCRTGRPITFVGRMNDDVNTYVTGGMRGDLFLTVLGMQLIQVPTQAGAGGMTELYLESGTYTKSFYTVMMAPSCTQVRTMGPSHPRMHHSIRSDLAVPKVLSGVHRRPQ